LRKRPNHPTTQLFLQAGNPEIPAREDIGITVSYWRDLESIKQWKNQAEHLEAQAVGKSRWYSAYTTRIALVERDYSL